MVNAEMYISREAFTVKPKGSQIAQLQNTILKHKQTVDPKSLAEQVAVQGHACKLCNLPLGSKNSKETPIINQRVLMLDIDNESEKHPLFRIEDAFQDEFLKSNAAFLYETFSSTLEKPKFRIVFFLDEPFTQNQDVENTYDWLIQQYPQSDSKCRETTRLFFGSNKGYLVINLENTWKPKLEQKKSSSKGRGRTKVSPKVTPKVTKASKLNQLGYTKSIPKRNSNVYTLIQQKEHSAVSKVIVDKNLPYYGLEFERLIDFKHYLLTNDNVSMIELLDLPATNPFRDIFHDEDEPSAGLFRTAEDNVELYKCFSDSQSFTGDILKVVGNLLHKSDFESLVWLKELLNITIKDESKVKKISDIKVSVNRFMKYIEKETLEKKYPYTHKVIRNYSDPIRFILEEFLEQEVFHNPKNNAYEIYTPLSITKIQHRLAKGNYGYVVSKKKIHTALTILSLVGIINKKIDSEIPSFVLEPIKIYQSINKQEYRTEIYTVNQLSYHKLSKVEDICKQLIELKTSIAYIDYDYIFNTFGKDIADATYISNTSSERVVSNKTQLIEDTAVKIILNKLRTVTYVEEKYLISRIKGNLRIKEIYMTSREVEISLKKCRASICDKYGLNRLSMTISNQKEYNITDIPKGKRPIVYMKDI